jgi:hypothetical protein
VPATYRVEPVPVTPTWRPAGDRVEPLFLRDRWELTYVRSRLTVLVTSGPPDSFDVRPEGTGRPVRMLGLPGKLYHGVVGDSDQHTLIVVTDRERGLSVLAYGYDEAQVRRFAGGLRWRPMPIDVPFEVALLPAGMTPAHIASHTMAFDGGVLGERYVAISLRGQVEPDPAAVPTTVDGHRADVVVSDERTWIRVFLAADRVLYVEAEVSLRFDGPALERLAAGVRITDTATVWREP